jgi:hypothetical protein
MGVGLKKLTQIGIAAILILVSLTVISACQRDIEISLAPIHEVRINFAESYPVQIFVYIKGGLRDGCTRFHDLTVERNGDIIKITVTTEHPRDAICPAVYGYFEKNVALGTDFVSGKTYTVKVNEIATTFKYP